MALADTQDLNDYDKTTEDLRETVYYGSKDMTDEDNIDNFESTVFMKTQINDKNKEQENLKMQKTQFFETMIDQDSKNKKSESEASNDFVIKIMLLILG